jgi:hypothetical protein
MSTIRLRASAPHRPFKSREAWRIALDHRREPVVGGHVLSGWIARLLIAATTGLALWDLLLLAIHTHP